MYVHSSVYKNIHSNSIQLCREKVLNRTKNAQTEKKAIKFSPTFVDNDNNFRKQMRIVYFIFLFLCFSFVWWMFVVCSFCHNFFFFFFFFFKGKDNKNVKNVAIYRELYCLWKTFLKIRFKIRFLFVTRYEFLVVEFYCIFFLLLSLYPCKVACDVIQHILIKTKDKYEKKISFSCNFIKTILAKIWLWIYKQMTTKKKCYTKFKLGWK